MAFIKKKEDFVCKNCGDRNFGNGFTNHCNNCLWSMHVDVSPGDRAEDCGGMMEPIEIRKKNGELDVLHKCQRCGFSRWNKVLKDDNFEAIINISNKLKN